MVNKSELAEFALKKMGGMKAVQQEFAKEQLMTAVGSGTTVGQLIEKFKDMDMLPVLLNMPVAHLSGGSIKPTSSGGRITDAEKDQLRQGILDFLKENPGSGKSAISNAVGFEASKVAVQLRALRTSKLISSKGSKAQTVYSLK